MFDLTYIMVGLQTREVQPLVSLITGVIDTTTLAMVKTIPHSTLAFFLVRLPGLKEIHGLQPLKGSCCVLMILLQVVQSERGFRSLMS